MASETNIVRYTADEMKDMVARGESHTNWDRVRNMTDAEIEANIDYEDEGYFDLSQGYVTSGPPLGRPTSAGSRIDAELLAWFDRRGPERGDEINDALRAYIAEQERKAS